jgi:chromosome segregation ATPase
MLGRLRLRFGRARELEADIRFLEAELASAGQTIRSLRRDLDKASGAARAEILASRQVQRENEVLRRRIEDFKLDRVVITSLAANVLRTAEALVDETTDWKVAG